MSLDDAQVAEWRGWIGRSERSVETLHRECMRRYAAASGGDLDLEARQPSLGHWAYFLPTVSAAGIGPDGHPKRGGFLPPVTLPRRMFAAGSFVFEQPLLLDVEAELVATIRDVKHRSGKSGELVLIEVERVLNQQSAVRLTERQTIVYREAGAPTSAVEDAGLAPETGDEGWLPGPVDLFRYSAVTFNSHRIHYDLPYATGEEGYPGLVVHGPLTATRLHAYAARRLGRAPVRFEFRAVAPLFCGQAVLLRPGEIEDEIVAVRCDGTTAMIARAE
jgi:3-methylfumaryl-CoA hydratase